MSLRISLPRPIVFVLILISVGDQATAQPDNPQDRRVAEAVRLLKEKDPSAQHRGPRKLDRLSSQAAPAVPALVTCLSDPDSTIRKEAANVLRRIGPEARSSVSALVVALNDPEQEVRDAAAWALAAILIHTMKDPDHEVRFAASAALQVIGMSSYASLRPLLGDRDARLRDDAASALAGLATIKGSSRREGETDEQARGRAASARSALFADLKNGDEQIRQGAARALGYVGEEVVPDLVKALEDSSPLVRLGAVRALGVLGDQAAAALEPVRQRLDDPAPEVRGAADITIKAITKQSR